MIEAIKRLPSLNPVFARELRERMRSRRAVVIVTVYLLLLTGILSLLARFSSAQRENIVCGPDGRCFAEANILAVASMGRVIFQTMLFFVLLLVCFIVPALTSGAIAGERERQTLVPLLITPLRPRSILAGKLLSSLAFIVLLLVATLPLLSASFWVGGVSLGELIKGMFMIVATAITLGCLALLCSTYVRRVQQATVLAYGLAFALTVGPFALYGVSAVMAQRPGEPSGDPSPAVLAMSPFAAVADVVVGERGAAEFLPTPFSPIQGLLHRNSPMPRIGFNGVNPQRRGLKPYWILSLFCFIVISAGTLALSAIRLRTPTDRGI